MAIDNASVDGTGPWLRSLIGYGQRNIMVQTHLRPHSLNRVWNESLRLAFHSLRLDYALLINNDLQLRPDTYRLLVADGGPFVTGVSISDPVLLRDANASSKSPHPSFSCFLIRRSTWEKVGEFDEDYWAYCSDADYHLRMDRNGIEAYAIAVPFLHEVSGTIKHADNATREMLMKRADADRETFQRKYGFSVGSPEYYSSFRNVRENRYVNHGRLD